MAAAAAWRGTSCLEPTPWDRTAWRGASSSSFLARASHRHGWGRKEGEFLLFLFVRVRVQVRVLSALFCPLVEEVREFMAGFVFEGLNLFQGFGFLFDLEDQVSEFQGGLLFLAFDLLEDIAEVLNVLQRLFHLLDFLLFGLEVPAKLVKSSARHVPNRGL